MGRKANPTCVYCALNYRTEDEAITKHPECYVGHNCRVKRNRLRNRSKVNAKRRQNDARKKGVATIEPILPEAYRAELEIYGKENQFVHAIANNPDLIPKRDSIFRNNLAVGLSSDINIHLQQAPRNTENSPWNNISETTLLYRQVSYTAYQYPFALSRSDCISKPD